MRHDKVRDNSFPFSWYPGFSSSVKSILMLFLWLLPVAECTAGSLKTPEEDTGYSLALLEQINLYRKENGLNRLQFDRTLAQLAKSHSLDMYQKQRMSHDDFEARFRQAGSNLCVENVGWNYSSPAQMFDGWRRSSGHNQNMLKQGVTRAGIVEIGTYVTYFACK